MNDLNFFESYIDGKRFDINKKLFYYIIILISFISLISFTIWNQIQIRNISKDIGKLKSVAEDVRINNKVEELKEKGEAIEAFKLTLGRVKSIDEELSESYIIDDYLLKSIGIRTPDSIFYKSMNIQQEGIELIGVSKDKQSIAELGKSLEKIKDFKEIFLSDISKEEIYYRFTLNINFKDVHVDEEDGTTEDSQTQEDLD